MKAGATQRFDCGDCNTEFEVTLEPKEAPAEGSKPPARPSPPKPVTHCPFCGSTEVTGDEDE